MGVGLNNLPPVDSSSPSPEKHQRRPRYRGTHPRRFHEKYKELHPEQHPDLIQKVIESGKTPAGTHRPILVKEILEILDPKPGEIAVDATLGYGGHSAQILPNLMPGGRLIGIDTDPLELPKTEERLRWSVDLPADALMICHNNFATLPRLLPAFGLQGVDLILADLGCSSMQFDDPSRGFSFKLEGPLDLRMNPQKGRPVSEWLSTLDVPQLTQILQENADEPHAELLAHAILQKHADHPILTTSQLSQVITASLPRQRTREDSADAIRRVFQALRIAINSEFEVLESFLRAVPYCLNPGGRVAILTFHSGEDRRVKHAFQKDHRDGRYSQIAEEVIRPSREEVRSNPRSSSAKLRWARKA